MGLFKKFSAWKENADKECERLIHNELSCEEMLEFIKKEFINDADSEYLNKITKAIKNGEEIDSPNENYTLYVDDMVESMTLSEKDIGQEKRNSYVLDSSKNWKKFYKALMSIIKDASAK